MRKSMALETTEQLHALAHPMRQRILDLLADQPKTNKQMASELKQPPSRVHFHVRELEKAGLIELVDQQLKGGIMEKYYLVAARNFYLGSEIGGLDVQNARLADSVLQTARERLEDASSFFEDGPPQLQIVQEELSLSDARLKRIKGLLESLHEEFQEAQSESESVQNYRMTFTYLSHLMPNGPAKGEPKS